MIIRKKAIEFNSGKFSSKSLDIFWGFFYKINANFDLGTIPIFRQKKDWVGGVGKWPFLLMFSTVLMLT